MEHGLTFLELWDEQDSGGNRESYKDEVFVGETIILRVIAMVHCIGEFLSFA